MIGLLVYLLLIAVIATVITVLYSLTRPINERGESRSWRVLIWSFVICFITPYALFYGLTHQFGKPMKEAIETAYEDSGFEGSVDYYRVVYYNGKEARALVIGEEPADWGGSERPIEQVDLALKDGKWVPVSYKILYSLKKNYDEIVIPAYW